MTDDEFYCIRQAEYNLDVDKRNDRTAVTLPIHVVEVLIRLARLRTVSRNDL